MCAVSSVGRALDLHSNGRGFKSLTAHTSTSFSTNIGECPCSLMDKTGDF